MKKYSYTGTSTLSFTFEGKDYVVSGTGPHKLPSESPVVEALSQKGDLVEIIPTDKKLNKLTDNQS